MSLILLAAGFALLATETEVLVRGASGIARGLAYPP
jgi:hypothetical protein